MLLGPTAKPLPAPQPDGHRNHQLIDHLEVSLAISCGAHFDRMTQNIANTAFIANAAGWTRETEKTKILFFVLHARGKRGIINPFNGVKWGGYITLKCARFSQRAFDRFDGHVTLAL